MEPKFELDGRDRTTFSPFILEDARDSEWEDVRLEFSDWPWLKALCGGDDIDGYYLNGYGVQGLVLATRLLHGLVPAVETMHLNSEGGTCYIHFTEFDEAVRTATLCAAMIRDKKLLRQAAAVAKEKRLGDGVFWYDGESGGGGQVS